MAYSVSYTNLPTLTANSIGYNVIDNDDRINIECYVVTNIYTSPSLLPGVYMVSVNTSITSTANPPSYTVYLGHTNTSADTPYCVTSNVNNLAAYSMNFSTIATITDTNPKFYINIYVTSLINPDLSVTKVVQYITYARIA